MMDEIGKLIPIFIGDEGSRLGRDTGAGAGRRGAGERGLCGAGLARVRSGSGSSQHSTGSGEPAREWTAQIKDPFEMDGSDQPRRLS